MNQSTMTDKNKRLQKFLKKKGIKGWLKPVDNLESSHFVLIENKRCAYNSLLVRTENYKILLERGETYPPDIVHFLVNNNKRNVLNVNISLITHKVMNTSKFKCGKFVFDVLSISKLSPIVFGIHRILSSDIIRPPIF